MPERTIAQTFPEQPIDRLLKRSVVICSAEGDNEVLYVTDAFERHTGYTRAEVIGRNMRLLQGEGTEPEAARMFGYLIRRGLSGKVMITNYRKDGSAFRHVCDLRPVRDAEGRVVKFVCLQTPEPLD